MSKNDAGIVVATVPSRKNVTVGKPRRLVVSSMLSKYGSLGGGSNFFGGGSFGGRGGGNTVFGRGGNFYSPELSTDFLELAQSVDEMRQYFRFFYDNDPFVGQAIDVHTELPVSKIRFGWPAAKDQKLARKAKVFCEKWADRVGLLHRILEMVHEYHKIGEAFVWAEDPSPDLPDEFYNIESTVDMFGQAIEVKTLKEDEETRQKHVEWVRKNYKGWSKIRILPPDQISIDSFSFTDEVLINLVIDSKTKSLVEEADKGDPNASRVVDSMPDDIVDAARGDGKLTLNTDPYAGSFISYLARKRSPYESRGRSILQRCLRVLVYRDKLRQAQTSIASRNMTPTRIVWSEGADPADIDALRAQVDLSLMDPDHSIVANYEIHWEEMSSNGRLLDLSSEYDMTDRQLYAGLGVTESLLSGESSYSGDRINLEVINNRYLLLREILQNFVEENLLKPMCHRMGFVEVDEYGDENIIYPSFSFTRLGIRDNDSTFDHLFNLYQKGSIDIWTILDFLNIDGTLVEERLFNDVGTLRDPNFNEVLRGAYSRIGDDLAEFSDFATKIAKYLKLNYNKPEEDDGGRF